MMDYLISFLVGGAICAVVQIVYEPFANWGKAGATVPLIGFGHLLFKGVKEAVDNQGFIGIFYGGLEQTAVGIAGALVLSFLASLIFKPKMS